MKYKICHMHYKNTATTVHKSYFYSEYIYVE